MRYETTHFRLSEMASLTPRMTPNAIRATDGIAFTEINFDASQAYTQSRMAEKHLNLFGYLPTAAIGLKSFPVDQHIETQNLPSLLSHPEITSIEGHEQVEGVDTVILKVGPRIPETERPGFLGNDGYVKLWIAPSIHSLAIRKEYHFEQGAADKKGTAQSVPPPVGTALAASP